MKQHKIPPIQPKYLLAGSGLVAALSLLFNLLPGKIPHSTPDSTPACQEIVQPAAVVSREQIAQLLTVPERSDRGNVQEIIKQPYCRLPSLSIRAKATTEREAYPLAFDPKTFLVVFYEGKTYVGYGFKQL